MQILSLTLSIGVIGVLVCLYVWRDRARVLQLAGMVMFLLATLIVVFCITGWPLFTTHVRGSVAVGIPLDQLQIIHRMIGSQSVLAVNLFGPVFVAAALCHPRGWRRGAHLLAAGSLVALWIVANITGYILPKGLTHPIPRNLASSVLRFVCLHIIVLPVLTGTGLVIIGYRHLRYSKTA
jgi:hypothetical protein